jgi:hypothetical protein
MTNDNFMKIVYEYEKYIIEEATKYYHERNKQNEKLYEIVNEAKTILTDAFINMKDIEIHLMSSIGAKLNLMNESDIDFGCLVKDLDEVKLFEVGKILNENGFIMDHITNPLVPHNKYYSFVRFFPVRDSDESIEVESKVRDMSYSQTILKLHHILDNDLSEKDRILITYIKYLLKINGKNNSSIKKYYNIFKAMLYNYYFYYVDGGFLLKI